LKVTALRFTQHNVLLTASVIGCLFFFLRIVAFVDREGANLPFSDEYWSFGAAQTAIQTVDGTVTLAKIFNSHGGHRVVWSHLLTALHTPITAYNLRFEMFFSVGLAGVTFLILVVMLRQIMPWAGVALAAVPIAGFTFSFMQYENWLWGMETCWYFVNFFALLTVAAAARGKPGPRAIAITLLLATCAMYALMQGIIAFVAGAVVLYVAGMRKVWHWALYFGAMAALLLLFTTGDSSMLSGMATNLPSRVSRNGLASLTAILRYMLGGSAGIIYVHPDRIADVGVFLSGGAMILTTLNFIWLWKHLPDRRALAAWFGLGVYYGGSAVLIALTRANPALQNDPRLYQSRYMTLWLFLWVLLVATSVAVLFRAEAHRIRRIIAFSAVILVTALFVNNELLNPPKFPQVIYRGRAAARLYDYLITDRRQPLVAIAGDHNTLTRDISTNTIEALAARRLTAFAEAPVGGSYIISLTNAPLTVIEDTETDVRRVRVNDRDRVVLFQQAPGLAEQAIRVPDIPAVRYEFRTEVLISPDILPAEPPMSRDQRQNGVRFAVLIKSEGAADFVQVAQAVFNPVAPNQAPIMPIRVDLEPYRGQEITLRYLTDPRNDKTYDWSVWVEPRVVVLPQRSAVP
jgi:hypothetical protein